MSPNPNSFLSALPGGDLGRRAALVVAGLAVVGSVWGVAQWAGAPAYVGLYRDLDLKEAAAMGDQLKKANLPYRLGDGGTAIEVPASEAARARVALAKDGLPSGGRPGLELFDKSSWGMTDFTQRVTYQRALEGELARSIAGIRGIAKAQVHLVLPERSALRKDERPAGAAVVVTLAQGIALPSETVQGITYLVSNSVDQLSSENVAVIDDAGRVLSAPASSGHGAAATSRQLELQRSIEQHLVDRAEQLLATTLGPGAARAQVAAEVNFDQVDRTVDTFDPDGQVLQSEQRGETAPPAGSEAGETVINNTYQNSRRLERILGSVGNIQRLSVAVLVDEKALSGAGAARDAELARLDALVRSALGVDSTRGDQMNVVALPFEPVAKPADGTIATAGKPGPIPPEAILVVERVSRPLVGVVAILVLLVIALRVLLGGAGGARGRDGANARPGEGQGEGESPALTLVKGFAPVRQRAQAETADRPEATAEVLRGWLGDTR